MEPSAPGTPPAPGGPGDRSRHGIARDVQLNPSVCVSRQPRQEFSDAPFPAQISVVSC